MSVTVAGEDRTGELTLAFTLEAIEQFDDPAAVFADAREWSRHVGVVDNDDEGVAAFVGEHDIEDDFDVGEADLWLALEGVREATVTPRSVLVGADPDHRRAAEHLGWEFKTPDEVAEKADWELAGEDGGSAGANDGLGGADLVGRLRSLVPDFSRSP